MRILVRGRVPSPGALRELASCPDTHDRGVAWSWSVSAVLGDGVIEDVLVSTEESVVDASSERVDLAGETVRVDVPAGQEVVLVTMCSPVDVAADDGWGTTLHPGDVLVSDGESQRVLDLRAPAEARLHVIRLRWKDGRPMRWVP